MSEQPVLFPESSPHVRAKKCTKCGEMKPVAAFGRAPHHKSGLTSSCQKCINTGARERWPARYAAIRKTNRRLHLQGNCPECSPAAKYCTKCLRHLPRNQFHLCTRATDGLDYICKACDYDRKGHRIRYHQPKKCPDCQTGAKYCAACKQHKSRSEFHRSSSSQDGLYGSCTACSRAKCLKPPSPPRACEVCDVPYIPSGNRVSRICGKAPCKAEARRRLHRRIALSKYAGMTPRVYERMLLSQGGGCAICGSTDSRSEHSDLLQVDHDHATGKVRGLLCAPCNLGIGAMADDSARLRKAADYLDSRRGDK